MLLRRFLSLRFTHTFQQPFLRFRSYTSSMPSIPDRWLDYKPVGQAIERTRFIPFKVPLKQLLHDSNRLPEHNSFTPSNLFELLEKKNLKLGLLIDLTFTKRYYNSEEITSYGVKYMKLFCAGKQIPNYSVVNGFTEVVNKFEEENADNDLLIGVHCTHGVNRTGYLICRYMIDHLQFTPAEALKAYEKARGYPVERTNYIQDLQTRPRDDEPEVPPRDSYTGKKKNYGRQSDDWSREYSTDRRSRAHWYQPYNRGRDHRMQGYDDTYTHRNDSYYNPSDRDTGNWQNNVYDTDYAESVHHQKWFQRRTPIDHRSPNQNRQLSHYSDRRQGGSTSMYKDRIGDKSRNTNNQKQHIYW